MRKIEVKIRQIIWCLKGIFEINNYDLVFYNNKKYYVKSSLVGNDIWDLYNEKDLKPEYKYIKGFELKIIHSLIRCKRVFKFKMSFQKSSWQSIDYNNKLGTRLSYLNSDNIYFSK